MSLKKYLVDEISKCGEFGLLFLHTLGYKELEELESAVRVLMIYEDAQRQWMKGGD